MKRATFITAVVVSLSITACATSGPHAHRMARPAELARDLPPLSPHPRLCAALRGNGELILAHFAALGALVEKLGVFDGLAGGSSASITLFIYESILRNPAVRVCPTCDNHATALRVALLLKSLPEYLDLLGDTPEAHAVFGVARLFSKAQEDGILKLLFGEPGEVLKGIGALSDALNAPELGDLVNPELKAMVSPAKVLFRTYQAREAFSAVQQAIHADSVDKKVFFRPGVLNYRELARKIGRVGSFYAGYGDFADHGGMATFLERCAPLAAGLDWFAFKKANPSCATQLHGLIQNYRTRLLANEDGVYSRSQDYVGAYTHILVATAALQSAEVAQFEMGRKLYMEDDHFDQFDFSVFKPLRFGYWGAAADVRAVADNPKNFTDLKTAKRLALSAASWEQVLALSPAEPGLSRIQEIDGSAPAVASVGGWPDLAPVLALKNIGCERVIYVTRQGEDAQFGRHIAKALGMSETESDALYNLKNPESSFAKSLAEADGVWCTHWDDFSVTHMQELVEDAHHARLIGRNESGPLGCSHVIAPALSYDAADAWFAPPG